MSETIGVTTRASAPMEEIERNRFLTFTLGENTFAMDIRTIREVIQHGNITEVPLMPPTVRGVINLRGAVVPVIDLAIRLGWAPTEITRRTCVVILDLTSEEDRSLISVMVDHVSEVLEISADEIEPPPTFGSGIRSDFIHGVGKVGGKFVLILDADRVLSIPELIALQAGSDGRINDAEALATRRIP